MEPYDEDSPTDPDLLPRRCVLERAVVVTVKKLRTSFDCVETCAYIDQIASEGHARVILDLTHLEKAPDPFYGFVQSLCRRHLEKGTPILVVGSWAQEADLGDKRG